MTQNERITRAEELAETWHNGNHSDVREALAELDPITAADVALTIGATLSDIIGGDSAGFSEALSRWADDLD